MTDFFRDHWSSPCIAHAIQTQASSKAQTPFAVVPLESHERQPESKAAGSLLLAPYSLQPHIADYP